MKLGFNRVIKCGPLSPHFAPNPQEKIDHFLGIPMLKQNFNTETCGKKIFLGFS